MFLEQFIRIRLDLVTHLRIKISERSFTRFDDSMSSFSSEKRIKLGNLIHTVRGDVKCKSVHVNTEIFEISEIHVNTETKTSSTFPLFILEHAYAL